MTILQLENLTGLDRATIRYYEREGLVVPSRKENSYRDYSMEDANEILKIKLLRQLDVSIESIRKLQQGSTDISSVLHLQATVLEAQCADKQWAADVCKEISASELTYQNLDASAYLGRQKTLPWHLQISVFAGVFKRKTVKIVTELFTRLTRSNPAGWFLP